MIGKVSVTEAKSRLTEIVSRVARRKKPVVLAVRGKPQAAIVSMEDLAFLESRAPKGNGQAAGLDAWLRDASALRQNILRRRGGIALPDSTLLLNELREERSDELFGLR